MRAEGGRGRGDGRGTRQTASAIDFTEGELGVTIGRWSALGLATFLLALGGCTSYPPLTSSGPQSPAPYLVGPGDTLRVTVWRSPELSVTVPVRPDGMISTPLVEDLQASGKTTTQIAREVEKVLTRYVQSPVVTVIVTAFGGHFSQQVRVIGEAAKPQALFYRENMTLLDVMIAVGGITDFAAGNRASIVRTEGGKTRQFGVRLIDLVKQGDLSANVEMRPGDVLIIPESLF
jgi:polysaccharide export outer membrane protein